MILTVGGGCNDDGGCDDDTSVGSFATRFITDLGWLTG